MGSLGFDCGAKSLLEHMVGRNHYAKFATKMFKHPLPKAKDPRRHPTDVSDGVFKYYVYKCGGSAFMEFNQTKWADDQNCAREINNVNGEKTPDEGNLCAMEVVFDLHYCSKFNNGTK